MITNDLNLPQPFVDAATSNYRYRPNRYSVSDVLGGTCEAVLKRRHQDETDADVADMVWAIFGTAVHKVLEDAKGKEGQLQEHRLSTKIGGYTLSGIADLYDPSTGTVTDYKTTSVWQVMFGDFEKWRRQVLLYCWILRKSGQDASNGEIVAILRDHSMRKAMFEQDYPKHPVFTIRWQFTEDDFAEIQGYVSQWFADLSFQDRLDDDELEPCSPEQRWHKPDKWAVMEKGRKKALRILDSEDAAREWAISKGIDPTDTHYYLEHREGEDTRCQSYCSVAKFCPYAAKISENSR